MVQKRLGNFKHPLVQNITFGFPGRHYQLPDIILYIFSHFLPHWPLSPDLFLWDCTFQSSMNILAFALGYYYYFLVNLGKTKSMAAEIDLRGVLVKDI